MHDANNCCIVHGETIHNASYYRRHGTRSRLDPYFVHERSFGKDESMDDFQNLINANESQISVHLPSLNSPLKSSFNNPYTNNLCEFPHADYDPFVLRNQNSLNDNLLSRQIERQEKCIIMGVKQDSSAPVQCKDRPACQQPNAANPQHSESTNNQSFYHDDLHSSSLTIQDNVYLGSLQDRSRQHWVYHDLENSQTCAPISSKQLLRTSVVRTQHTESYLNSLEQNGRDASDGSDDYSIFHQCRLDQVRRLTPKPSPPPKPALDFRPALTRRDDLQDRRIPSAPWTHADSSLAPVGGDQGAVGVRRSKAPPLRSALRAGGPVRGNASASATMTETAQEQAALRTAFRDMVRRRRDVARNWLCEQKLASARLRSDDRSGGPGGSGTRYHAVEATGTASGSLRTGEPPAGSDGGGGDREAESRRWRLQSEVVGKGEVAGPAPAGKGPADEEQEGEGEEEEEEQDLPPCACAPFGRPAAPFIAGQGKARARGLLERVVRTVSTAVRG